VLDGCCNDMAALASHWRFDTDSAMLSASVPPLRKQDFIRPGVQEPGDGSAGGFDRPPCRLSFRINGRGIAGVVVEIWKHGGHDFGGNRGCGCVIEVNAFHDLMIISETVRSTGNKTS